MLVSIKRGETAFKFALLCMGQRDLILPKAIPELFDQRNAGAPAATCGQYHRLRATPYPLAYAKRSSTAMLVYSEVVSSQFSVIGMPRFGATRSAAFLLAAGPNPQALPEVVHYLNVVSRTLDLRVGHPLPIR